MSTADVPRSSSSASRESQAAFAKQFDGPIQFSERFCPPTATTPFDTTEWELRSAAIKDERGEVLFEQHDCEIPQNWSQLATNVVVSKYFYGEVGTAERESSVRQLVHRVTSYDCRLGDPGRLLRLSSGWREILPRSDVALFASARSLQLARLVQRRLASSVRRVQRQMQLAVGSRD